jgi:predicted alpha/beta hydrolase
MIHGAVENGRIFYSKNGKGLAPFLCENNSDVFVIDIPGRGDSKPHASEKLNHSQSQFIKHDLPIILNTIRSKTMKGLPWHGIGHSWGGVLMAAALIRMEVSEFKSLVFFGVKRRITVKSIKKYLYVNVYWNYFGSLLTKIYGYLPAKKWKLGSDDEPTVFALQIMDWVVQEKWIDHEDGFDYLKAFEKSNLPPILSLTGSADKILGNQQDVALLMKEIGQEDGEIVKLGKDIGSHEDYDHIDILTHPNAKKDGYLLALDWIKEHDK